VHPGRFLLFLLVLVLLVVIVGPLLAPLPPLFDTVPAAQLADTDSRFVEVNGLQVHYKMVGAGKPVMVLLHGFASSTYTWHKVMSDLAKQGTVIAFDRPAFGLTERPLPGSWTGDSPYSNESAVKLTVGLMDALGMSDAVLVGHSAGAAIAMQTALEYPARIEGLVLVDAAISANRQMPAWIANTPQMKRLGPYLSRSLAGKEGDAFLQAAWHDPSKFTQADKDAYRKPLQIENWDIALWQYTIANRDADLENQLGALRLPVLVLSGDDDRIVPAAQSEKLANGLPNRRMVVLSACGHVPQEECPEEWLPPVLDYLAQFKQ